MKSSEPLENLNQPRSLLKPSSVNFVKIVLVYLMRQAL
jgi:hypothetical protein